MATEYRLQSKQPGKTRLTFGRFKGTELMEMPHWYLVLIADDSFGDARRAPWDDKKFGVPDALILEARALLEWRGHRKIGMRWELV